MIFLSHVQMLSHPVLVSSGETMAPWVVTVEGDLPKLQRVDYDLKLCGRLFLSECLAHVQLVHAFKA